MNGRFRSGSVVGVLGVVFAFGGAGCGPPRDEAYAFEEKRCGTWRGPRTPNPAPEATDAKIHGRAARLDADTVSVSLAPLVDVRENAVIDWTEAGVTVTSSASGALDCELRAVADAARPEAVDIVFVLDTTGSMLWAIDGVRSGIQAFVSTLQGFNVDARVGGVEFGDEVRTSVPLGDIPAFRVWLEHMTATGGGDTPENPLDALEVANGFGFRDDALRYMIVITDTGMHERTDGTDCSETTLRATQAALDPNVFVAVVHPNLASPDGVHPRELTRALGGLFVALGSSTTADFDISLDTPADDVLGSIAVLRCGAAGDAGSVEVGGTVNGEPVTTTLDVVE
ncbi:MAG TPA: vWA domain-containing protein [Polyangiaceae bacterium]